METVKKTVVCTSCGGTGYNAIDVGGKCWDCLGIGYREIEVSIKDHLFERAVWLEEVSKTTRVCGDTQEFTDLAILIKKYITSVNFESGKLVPVFTTKHITVAEAVKIGIIIDYLNDSFNAQRPPKPEGLKPRMVPDSPGPRVKTVPRFETLPQKDSLRKEEHLGKELNAFDNKRYAKFLTDFLKRKQLPKQPQEFLVVYEDMWHSKSGIRTTKIGDTFKQLSKDFNFKFVNDDVDIEKLNSDDPYQAGTVGPCFYDIETKNTDTEEYGRIMIFTL